MICRGTDSRDYIGKQVADLDNKIKRILSIYERLMDGRVVSKKDEAARFGVNERSIQRDIEDIRDYLDEEHPDWGGRIEYSRSKKGFVFTQNKEKYLTDGEIFAVCKILLESRSMVKAEMDPIIDKLLELGTASGRSKKNQEIDKLIRNEKHLYLEPHHKQKIIDKMWEIGRAVSDHKLIRMQYKRLKGRKVVERLVQPVGIMFSEFYFYLCAYNCNDEGEADVAKRSFPRTYRIDRIKKFEILEKFKEPPYAERFQEGEFRKRVQFMFGGELRTVKFIYKGLSIESVLDRLPTAKIIKEDEDKSVWVLKAEVYGDGIDMWFRSQGDYVEVIDSGKKGRGDTDSGKKDPGAAGEGGGNCNWKRMKRLTRSRWKSLTLPETLW